jgi:chromate transporter
MRLGCIRSNPVEGGDAMSGHRSYSLSELVLYFLKLGSIGFGGPVALVGYMYRDLVEPRHWIAEDDYKEGLTLAQLMPGPLAAQLAMYLGYVRYRVLGATAAGIVLALVTVGLIWKVKKLPDPVVVAIAAVIGLIAFPGTHS